MMNRLHSSLNTLVTASKKVSGHALDTGWMEFLVSTQDRMIHYIIHHGHEALERLHFFMEKAMIQAKVLWFIHHGSMVWTLKWSLADMHASH
jgi:hypothetical protein